MSTRHILLHYHLFKNGGTSIDKVLTSSFGAGWHSFDKPEAGARICADELSTYLADNPGLKALSSHQILPPLPVGDFQVTPIVVLRHPLSRVRSAWLFEWQRQLDLPEPCGPIDAYVREKLQQKNSSVIADFQAFRLGHEHRDRSHARVVRHDPGVFERAMALIDELPCFGLVEQFSESLAWLADVAGPHFPELDVREYHENRLQPVEIPVCVQMEQLQDDLGQSLFNELHERNRLDLQLYRYAQGRFNALRGPAHSHPDSYAS